MNINMMDISTVFSLSFLFCAILSIFFSAFLYIKRVEKHGCDTVLIWFLLVIFVHILYIIVGHLSLIDDIFNGQGFPFGVFYTIFYWCVVCKFLNKSFGLKDAFLHGIPAIVFCIGSVVLFSVEDFYAKYYLHYLYGLQATTALLFLSYSFFGYFIVFNKEDNIVDSRIRKFILEITLIMIVTSLMLISNLFGDKNIDGIKMFDANFLLYLMMFASILIVDKLWLCLYVDEKKSITNSVFEEKFNKYHKSRIKESDLIESMKMLENMEIKVFLDSNLTLEKLAQLLKIPQYDLSQVFSIGFKTSFSKYVNKKRCEYACELLLRRRETNDAIEDIVLQAGFNSSATFYRSFKENYGVVPSQFS